jgi:hypothetical protein
MHLTLRRGPVTGAAALAGILAFTGPAAADDLSVKNNADVAVKVVVKNGSTDIGHADISKKSSGKVTLSAGVSLAKITSVEATAIGANTHCSTSKSGSSQYEVKCDAVASAPAPPSGSGSAPAAQQTTRPLEIQNDLKDPVTVFLKHTTNDGKRFSDEHDIEAHASATFTMPVDSSNQITEFTITRHLDTQRVPCGALMRYEIPTSQQKVFVTAADGSAPPPAAEKRADSRPCVLSQTSRIEKADPKTSGTPPAAPPAAGGKAAATTTKFVVENDLKDPIQISTMGGFIEEHTIDPKQSITFDHPVPHPDGKSDTSMEVYISRSVNMRMISCGIRQQYVIPAIPEVKFYVTRVGGSEWPPKPKPGEDGGGGGAGAKGGSVPPPPSCQLTRTQNYEK